MLRLCQNEYLDHACVVLLVATGLPACYKDQAEQPQVRKVGAGSRHSLVAYISIKYLSSDNDPLFQYHRWQANLHVLEIEAVKSAPSIPL